MHLVPGTDSPDMNSQAGAVILAELPCSEHTLCT